MSAPAADPTRWTGFVADVARTVPAYGTHLRRHEIDPAAVSETALAALPAMTKADYVQRYPLVERCRGGALPSGTMIAMSSGSSGSPTAWPRDLREREAIAVPFRRILRDGFGSHERRTLAVVCFPLGLWVGGLYTLGVLQDLARSDVPMTVVAPGNVLPAILSALAELAEAFEQVVLFGYPPFLKDVVDAGSAAGVRWDRMDLRLVFAGEVFSEAWRDALCARAAIADPAVSTAAVYGTADAGVLAFETAASIRIRREISADTAAVESFFGAGRLPALMQYDASLRRFDVVEGELFLTTDGAVPLVRYTLGDRGGVATADDVAARARAAGLTAVDASDDPFVWLYGRGIFALSLYGANVFPETIAVGLESSPHYEDLTGKFVIEVAAGDRPQLVVTVELRPGVDSAAVSSASVAAAVLAALAEQNGEYVAYVPVELQLPRVQSRPHHDAEYFAPGIKHRYTRIPKPASP